MVGCDGDGRQLTNNGISCYEGWGWLTREEGVQRRIVIEMPGHAGLPAQAGDETGGKLTLELGVGKVGNTN